MDAALAGPIDLLINPRRVAAFAALLAFGLLLLQYAHRRRPFILLWAAGWLAIAPAMLLLARSYASPRAGHVAIGLAQLLGITSAAMFIWSGDAFRQSRLVRLSWLRVFTAMTGWFLLAPLAFGVGAVITPGFALQAIGHAAAGAMFGAVLIERRMIGAGLNALVLFALAIANVTTIFLLPQMAAAPHYAFNLLAVNSVLHALGALGINILVFEDMTYELRLANRRLEAAREELMQAAITDPLTGCHNRRFFDQVADHELQRHDRFALPLSLLFVDINKFKQVNDTLGHEMGDRVLQYVARFLRRHIREADYMFRWGGDEFLVLITCGGEEAGRKAAVLKSAFDAAPDTRELPPGLGLSVGSIEVPAGTTDLMPLIARADELMYADKGRGLPPQPVPARVPAVKKSRSPWRRSR